MAKKRLTQALQGLTKSALKLDRNLSVKDRFWLWRSSLIISSPDASTQAGFILPTITLLLLMLSLVLGVLIFRTGNRTNQVIGERQQRQVYNAATPAIDRARSKLEYLFTQEAIPTLPSEANIDAALRKDDPYTLDGETRVQIDDNSEKDPAWAFKYDSKGDQTSDVDDVIVVYSILSRTTNGGTSLQSPDQEKAKALVVRNGPINLTGGAGNPACPTQDRSPYQGWQNVTGSQLRKAFQVHAFAIAGPNNPNKTVATLEMQQDKVANLGNKWGAWFRTDMEVFPGPAFRWNGAMNTAGSYFVRSEPADADSPPNANRRLGFYPISAPTSCVFTEDSSEMVMSLIEQPTDIESQRVFALNNDETYQGQFVIGSLRDNDYDGGVDLYGFTAGNAGAPLHGELTKDNDSVDEDGVSPIDLALEPVVLLTEGINRRRDDINPNAPITDDEAANRRSRGPDKFAWDDAAWVKAKRLHNEYQAIPFVDDTYRADDRWGPKPIYKETPPLVSLRTKETGTELEDPSDNYLETVVDPKTNQIPASNNTGDNYDALLRDEPIATNTTDEEGYGLDGYWERRARDQGVRIVVGQRLELGNDYGWFKDVDVNGDGVLNRGDGDIDHNNNGILDFDPLYPPPADPGKIVDSSGAPNGSMANRQNELMQWKTLRDNPAAAQSTAVYHYLLDEGRYPAACLASAAHYGTNVANRDSRKFDPVEGTTRLPDVDFLTGKGTNGWEFAPFGIPVSAEQPLTGRLTSGDLTDARNNFIEEVNDENSPLRIALSNLAYFSGDLAGAFPAFQDQRDGIIAANSDKFRLTGETDSEVGAVTHPYPILTMWGDFSNLRRVIDKLDPASKSTNGAELTYDDLSLADQTTLQTATCTLGILAYNLQNKGDGSLLSSLSRGALTRLTRSLRALSDADLTNGHIQLTPDAGAGTTKVEVFEAGVDAAQPGAQTIYTSEVVTSELTPNFVPPNVIADALPEETSALLKALQREQQINRDRLMGFAAEGQYETEFSYQPNEKILGLPMPTGSGKNTNLQCDFEGSNYLGFGEPDRKATEIRFLELAYAICPIAPKYPSLYYLFPKANHDHIGNVPAGVSDDFEFLQPNDEPYTSSDLQLNGARFDNRYAYNRANNGGANVNRGAGIANARFRVVGDSADGKEGVEDSRDDGFAAIALVPKARAAWALPSENGTGGANTITDNVTGNTNDDEPNTSIAMLDTGIFNGREQMGVRVLSVDLDLLRNNTVTGVGPYAQTEDYWLPLATLVDPAESPTRTGAAIYAFREDAVREDGIARPRDTGTNAEAWREAWRKYSVGDIAPEYIMRAASFNKPEEQDPPLNPANGLSPKPVDYYADPARRPHGFRLLNGIDLTRSAGDLNSDGIDDSEDERGMSFVSDNAVYIQGDFNIHSEDGTVGKLMEEYEGNGDNGKLKDDWSNFYERTELNQAFARAQDEGEGKDTWRATEIVTDAINILSDDFVDGFVSQGILNANGSDLDNRSSFRALNYPTTNAGALSWVTSDGRLLNTAGRNVNDAIRDEGVPLKISQRGFPVYCAVPGSNDNIVPNPASVPDGSRCDGLGGVEREYGLATENQDFLDFSLERDDLQEVQGENYVNALVVSGIIPSRENQANGGLHNFPRTIEDWEGSNLWFGGSLFQLNFSTASTGPYDQDAWEPVPDGGNPPASGSGPEQEQIWYYRPPGRRWGYDVALQYVQPPPVAQRFSAPSNIRSEFFQELPVDDPYIELLRCVTYDGAKVDETAACK